MPLKKHHKWIIGSSSFIVILFMILISVFVYSISVRQEFNHNQLSKQLEDLQLETQTNINTLSESIINNREELDSISSNLGVINEEFSLLKASVGEDFSDIIDSSVQAVVTIRTDVGQGTGFIITDKGYIVTNAHVLSGGSVVSAITYDQQVIGAELIGYDSTIDIALLKIPGSYSFLDLANSNNVQVGEKVIAIGNPLGLQFSVSQGIVSGIHREGPNGLSAYIQTDAALNPGNSGGPLINTQGNVIGINNFKAGNSESLGFALESNYIEQTVNSISQEILQENLV